MSSNFGSDTRLIMALSYYLELKELFDKFTGWVDELTPDWVGYVIFLTVFFPLLVLFLGLFLLSIFKAPWVLLGVVFGVVFYAFYVAIFKQGEDE